MNAFERYKKHLEGISTTTPPKMAAIDFKMYWQLIGEHIKPGYEVDETAKLIAATIYKSNKGGLFTGARGIGKTLNMDIYCKLATDILKTPCEAFETTEIEINYKTFGSGFLERIAKLPVLIINDIGIESDLNDFGTHRNIVADLLFIRYREFQMSGKRTFCTSNFNINSLNERYGKKLADRFKEMFEYVELKGESKR